MIEYILNLMHELDFEDDAIRGLSGDLLRLYSNEDARQLFEAALRTYEEDIHTAHAPLIAKAEQAATFSGVHLYSAALLLYLGLTRRLRQAYVDAGIDLDIFRNSILDLKWKMLECKAVKGVWGTFVATWFDRFYDLTCFALGRLQFELIDLGQDYSKNGKSVKKGSKVINVHIPRTLTPIDPESCRQAYDLAKEFFQDRIGPVPVTFVCGSWLLFPPFIDCLDERFNVYKFAKQYDVFYVDYDPIGVYPNAWRLFDMDYVGDLDALPEDTGLRKVIKTYMKTGAPTGSGYGIFFWGD